VTAILIVFHIIFSILLVLFILLHRGQGGGLSDMFGGGVRRNSGLRRCGEEPGQVDGVHGGRDSSSSTCSWSDCSRRRAIVRTRRSLVLGLAVAGLLAGCTGRDRPRARPRHRRSSQTQSPTPATTRTSASGAHSDTRSPSNPGSIDPRFVRDDGGLAVVDALFDSLVTIADDLITIEPSAAADWEISDDGLTYTFTLRPDGIYHDGSPVVAQDFVRSFQRIVDRTVEPESFLFYQLEPVVGYEDTLLEGAPLAGVTAADDTVLEIRLRVSHQRVPACAGAPQPRPDPTSRRRGSGPLRGAADRQWTVRDGRAMAAQPVHSRRSVRGSPRTTVS
jgi:hypothetical protein